jgi:hypothetical protein
MRAEPYAHGADIAAPAHDTAPDDSIWDELAGVGLIDLTPPRPHLTLSGWGYRPGRCPKQDERRGRKISAKSQRVRFARLGQLVPDVPALLVGRPTGGIHCE